MSPRVRLFPAAVALSLAACFQDFSTAPEPARRLLEHVSPASAEGPPGSVVASPTVRVVERGSGKPIPNVEVEFLPRPQSGSITNVVTRTDAAGVAGAGPWTLPVQAGAAVLDVQADGLRISFTATVKPGEPVALKALDSTIAWIAGEAAPEPVVVVVDRYGNPVDGASVAFAVILGGGQLSRTETATANGGKASPGVWLLGSKPGENVLRATFAEAAATFRTLGLDRASFVWHELETVGGLPVPGGGFDRGRLGLTQFDRCLCADETGHFVMEAILSPTALVPTGHRLAMAGRYRIQSRQIQLIGEGGETRASPQGGTIIYMIRDQAWPHDKGRFRIDMARWFQASSAWFTQAWMFRETGS